MEDGVVLPNKKANAQKTVDLGSNNRAQPPRFYAHEWLEI